MTPDAIIFDMDGVLVDSEPVHFEALQVLLRDHGVVYTPLEDEDFHGCTDRDVFRELRRRYGLVPHEHDLAERWIEEVVSLLPGRIVPMPGVPGVLEQLRASGVRLALASSSSPPIIEATITGLDLGAVFETTVSGREVQRGKPAPDIFLEAAARLKVPAGDCLVVEDSPNGLRAALAAGMRCVVVPCTATAGSDFPGATARLDTLLELPRWIGELGM